MIVFVHFPKAAGSSLRTALKKAYGKRFYLDSLFPGAPEKLGAGNEQIRLRLQREAAAKQTELENDYDIVFGHFRADKYDFLGNQARLCIILREPIARMCSEYFYHIREGNFIRRKQEGISLLEFAQLPEQIHFYELYLGGRSIEDFHYVGLVEHLPISIELYRRFFDKALKVPLENKGDVDGYFPRLEKLGILDQVLELQASNTAIYYQGVQRMFELWQHAIEMTQR